MQNFQDYLKFLEKAKTINISKNFTLYEVARSDTAMSHKISNIPTPQIVTAATLLINKVLQPIRSYYNKPIIINCMYRSIAVNKFVGGVSTSQHCTGEAADFNVAGVSASEVVRYVRKNLIFDQLIHEKTGTAEWLHVSFSSNKNRKQVLKFNGKSYVSI